MTLILMCFFRGRAQTCHRKSISQMTGTKNGHRFASPQKMAQNGHRIDISAQDGVGGNLTPIGRDGALVPAVRRARRLVAR